VCEREGTGGSGTEVPSDVQGQSLSMGSGGTKSPEAEVFLLMNALILMPWKKKLVKRQKYHRQKLGSAERGTKAKYSLVGNVLKRHRTNPIRAVFSIAIQRLCLA